MYVILLSHPILIFVVVGSEFLKFNPFYTVQGSVQVIQVLERQPEASVPALFLPLIHA